MTDYTILMILSHFPDNHNPISGIFTKRIVDELVDNKHCNIIVVAPKPRLRSLKKIKNTLVHNLESVSNKFNIYRPEYFPIPTMISKKIKVHVIKKAIIRCIEKNKLRFDIVDSRYAFPWSYVGLGIALKYGKPPVSTFIGDDINTDIFRSNYIFKCVNKVVNQSTIIAVSTELKRITERSFQVKGINVIYDGIKFSELEKFQQTDKGKLINSFRPTVGFVGQLSEEKGCLTLYEIIKRTKELFNWIIVGDGPLLKRFAKMENVLVPGNVHPTEVFDYYQQMDVMLFPTKKEGIPNVLKEAAFFEIPIIASSVGGIPEMTNDGKLAVLIEDYANPDSFIIALNDYLKNKNEFITRAKKLKDYTIRKFDVTVNVSKLLKLYEELYLNTNEIK